MEHLQSGQFRFYPLGAKFENIVLQEMKTTKELAKELGLIRRRSIASCRDVKSDERSSGQTFKYLIVIDFESTCWKDSKFRTQEIIEFPAVLLNTVTGEIESEFHHYVQPQEEPTLSAFCTELTGITQEKVDNGIPLNFCLRKFRYWLDKLHKDKGVICTGTALNKDKEENSNTTCVTWSDWDLGVCLQYECKRKQLLKPAELTSWIDLRATYRKFYQRKPNGLNGALQDLGINFQGREHSGVDDARNTAKLAYRLIKDGCVLKVTKSLKTHERSSSCTLSIGSYFKPEASSTKPHTPDSFKKTLEKNTPSKIPRPIKQAQIHVVENTKVIKDRQIVNKQNGAGKNIIESVKSLTPTNGKVSCKASKHDTENSEKCTPAKLKVSYKRKEITPLKERETGIKVNSPCRKAPRKFTPKKLSATDVFIDPFSTREIRETSKLVCKTGLTENDVNIPSTKQGHVLSEKTNIGINRISQSPKAVFKKPNPINGSRRTTFSPQQGTGNFNNKNFCASTPVNKNLPTKPFICSSIVSPVPIASSTSTSSGNTTDVKSKTPKTISKVSNNFTANTPFGTFHVNQRTPNFSASSMNCQSMSLNGSNSSSMKMTPPLCKCGRRSKRKMVQSPGQNLGRFFFSCGVRKSTWSKEGCDFFKWEVASSVNATSSLPAKNGGSVSKQFTPVLNTRSTGFANNSQKRNLGVRSVFKTPMCIR